MPRTKNSIPSNTAKGFALALSMLTTIPFFRVHNFFSGINGYAVMFYPLIGFILGSILFLFHHLLGPYLPSAHLNILLFGLWALLTGALHLDGFSDTIDALFVPKERAMEVMKDSHIGAMGMTFTAVFLILKASALWHLDTLWTLPLVLMLARFNAVLAIYFFSYIRENGMGSLAKSEFTFTQLLISSAIVLSTAFIIDTGLMLLVVSSLTLLLLRFWFTRRFGGFSGDTYGFMIEITELILLHVVLIGALV